MKYIAAFSILILLFSISHAFGIDDALNAYGKPTATPKISPTPSVITQPVQATASVEAGKAAPHEKFKMKLRKGWNMISSPLAGGADIYCEKKVIGRERECENKGKGRNNAVPLSANLTGGKITETDCDPADIWHLDAVTKQYVKFGKLQADLLLKPGDGYWVLITNESCTVKLEGNLKVSLAGKKLKTGLNQIGGPFFATNVKDLQGDCTVSSGPFAYRYKTNKGEYVKAESLKAGEGYFVSVTSDCTLSDKKIT